MINGPDRWSDLDALLLRQGNITGPDFEPCPELRQFLQDDCRVLCVGAGGLGCELLKDLALSGFGRLDVIDMDTIDVSNLNRQFLFRHGDVGRPKAEVAAARVAERVPGVQVTPHFCRIEEKDTEWYAQFHVIVLGLDSLEARRHMNAIACGLLEYGEDGAPDLTTVKPLIDGGTEGLKGHARIILPSLTPCFDCTLWLFPPQTKFPLCTLAETPRTPAHCIEYAKIVQWPAERPGVEFDGDAEEHVSWVAARAAKRAAAFGIEGVTYALTQGVVKNIVPAIASTNAVVAAACTLEALKVATLASTGMSNYMMYVGTSGVYTHTAAYERDPECAACSPGLPLEVPRDATLQQVLDALQADPRLEGRLAEPSVSHGSNNLYMRGVLEEATRGNLSRPIAELVGAPAPGDAGDGMADAPGDGGDGGAQKAVVLSLNDRKLPAPLRVRLRFAAAPTPGGG